MKKFAAISLVLILTIWLSGCVSSTPIEGNGSKSEPVFSDIEDSSSDTNVSDETHEPVFLDPADYLPSTRDYIDAIVKEHVAKIEVPDMTEYEKVKASFDYIIDIGYYNASVALDSWRWKTRGDSMPTYEEMRGLNMLIYGVETCEGYAAALHMLLNEMGIATKMMTGYTYAAGGNLTYHTWSQVRIDGVWYNLDCDLEDDISSGGTVRYKYFLRSDETMGLSHFWGQRLINLGRLEPGQVEIVREEFMGEVCPQNYPTPAPRTITVTPRADRKQLREDEKVELAEYERLYGKLEWIELDVVPPVFIKYYLGSEDEGDDTQGINWVKFADTYQNRRCIIREPGTSEETDYRFPWAGYNSNN